MDIATIFVAGCALAYVVAVRPMLVRRGVLAS